MLDENYNLKVIDFGDSKKENEEPIEDTPPEPVPQAQETDDDGNPVDAFAEDMMSMHSDSSGGDRRGTLVGTMNYLAPEMIQT